MSIGFMFSLCSLCYIASLTALFFSKERIKTFENKIYGLLIIINFVGIILAIVAQLTIFYLDETNIFNIIVANGLLIYYITWSVIFAIYVFSISLEDEDLDIKKHKGLRNIIIAYGLVFLIVVACIIVLPVYNYETETIVYAYGPAVDLAYTVIPIITLTFFLRILFAHKNIKKQKYLPIIVCILLVVIVTIIQSLMPGLLLLASMQTFVTFLMYFAVENPDVKLIKQLELAKGQAEKANNAKTDFLSSMSHEIRTPLNAIVGFSQYIENADNLDEAKEDARDIVMASQNLLEIVNGILDISKIEANKMEIINTEYNLKGILENLTKLIIARIGEKPIELKTQFASDIPDVLYGDCGKLKQIMTNILTNSVKYSEKGEINFKVNCINEQNECKLMISISDTGRGMTTEQVNKLFNKFERFDEEKNTNIEGTGLGLSITKSLVEMMGGKIVVQSEYGKGSTFTVYLSQEIRNSLYTQEKIIENINLDLKNKKVLLVDDNLLNLKVATKLLQIYNLDITCCTSGFECIEKIENKLVYDIILMDIMMPKMGGVETLTKLKQIPDFNTPVIALTADAIQGKEKKYKDVGFNDYLSKPIEKNELVKVLSKYLSDN